jgi:UDP-N-acetylglucosamine 3-dehydrogenase
VSSYRIGIIGTGKPWRSEGSTGFGMAHAHMRGYQEAGAGRLAAVADIVEANGAAFAEQYGGAAVYTDYKAMLASEQLDIVSVCTWPALHAPMVLAAAEAGVKAIHCEKPMAPTFGEARAMAEACAARGVQLTFNHQRRFNTPFRAARELLRSGAIGKLQRMEGNCGNLFDWGTHWFDMFGFYNDESPAKWVMGQVDTRDVQKVFGVPLETYGLSYVQYQNGVQGLMLTGEETLLGCANRLVGSDGTIEVLWSTPWVRVRAAGEREWRAVDGVEEGIHAPTAQPRVMADIADALATGREPELSARRALQATEVIFATYESSRRRARVDLPLAIDDSPLEAIIAG